MGKWGSMSETVEVETIPPDIEVYLVKPGVEYGLWVTRTDKGGKPYRVSFDKSEEFARKRYENEVALMRGGRL